MLVGLDGGILRRTGADARVATRYQGETQNPKFQGGGGVRREEELRECLQGMGDRLGEGRILLGKE